MMPILTPWTKEQWRQFALVTLIGLVLMSLLSIHLINKTTRIIDEQNETITELQSKIEAP